MGKSLHIPFCLNSLEIKFVKLFICLDPEPDNSCPRSNKPLQLQLN